MTKSNWFLNNSDCPIKETCGFYDKQTYETKDVQYYMDHCLNGGEGCGLKNHNDLTKKLEEKVKGGKKLDGI